jgi:thiol-disulfide isomerase/thioredoxin
MGGFMNKLARIALLVTLLAASFGPARSSVPPSLATAGWEGWQYGAAGYARAVQLQRELNVPLVVYFYADWCPYCRTLDSQYLPSTPVQDYLQGVVKVRISPEHGTAERELAKRFGVTGYPFFLVIRNSAAQGINVNPFRRVGGNLTPTQFANACRAVAPLSRKTAPVPSSGVSGKFRERQTEAITTRRTTRGSGVSGKFRQRQAEVNTTKTTTSGGTQIVTVSPSAAVSPRAPRKSQP